MIEFFVKPILTGLAIVALICIGMEIDSEIYIRKSRERREIFFEAMERHHQYRCIGGKKDKSIKDFIREVEKEREKVREDNTSKINNRANKKAA